MKKLMCIIFLSASLWAGAQELYTYKMLNGWRTFKYFSTSEDSFISVGLTTVPGYGNAHQYIFHHLNGNHQILKHDSFILPITNLLTIDRAASIYRADNKLTIAGTLWNETKY